MSNRAFTILFFIVIVCVLGMMYVEHRSHLRDQSASKPVRTQDSGLGTKD